MYNHPLFLNVDLKKYESRFEIKKYPANSLLFHEGDECYHLGIILRGQLIISTLTSLDKEYVINILNRNDNSGFGLSMMKERVYLLSGEIEITSEKNIGTRILVRVPIYNKEEK